MSIVGQLKDMLLLIIRKLKQCVTSCFLFYEVTSTVASNLTQ